MSKLTNNVGNLILFIDVEVPAGDIKRSTFIEKLLASPQRNLQAIVGAIFKTDFLSSNAIDGDDDTYGMMTSNLVSDLYAEYGRGSRVNLPIHRVNGPLHLCILLVQEY